MGQYFLEFWALGPCISQELYRNIWKQDIFISRRENSKYGYHRFPSEVYNCFLSKEPIWDVHRYVSRYLGLGQRNSIITTTKLPHFFSETLILCLGPTFARKNRIMDSHRAMHFLTVWCMWKLDMARKFNNAAKLP